MSDREPDARDAGDLAPGPGRSLDGGRPRQVSGDPEGPGGMKKPPGPGVRGVIEGVAEELEAGGIDDPRREAERLVCYALGVERHELALGEGARIGAAEAGRLAGAVRRRLQGEPLQYIEGTVQFRELVLLCDRRALIPRPETEQLVERVTQWVADRSREGRLPGSGPGEPEGKEPALGRILDVGTGSGAIALSLLQEGKARSAVGIDVSREALMLAAENRDRTDLNPERFELRLASRPLWNSVSSEERFDLVVSNPPYVSDGDLESLPREVREYEPEEALAGGEDGLSVVREIAGRAAGYLNPGGALFLEIGEEQGEAVRELLESSGEWEEVAIGQDLAGRDRFARAVAP